MTRDDGRRHLGLSRAVQSIISAVTLINSISFFLSRFVVNFVYWTLCRGCHGFGSGQGSLDLPPAGESPGFGGGGRALRLMNSSPGCTGSLLSEC